jgi:hypothetical protein
MIEYTDDRCPTCGSWPHPDMRFEHAFAAVFNAIFNALEWATRA